MLLLVYQQPICLQLPLVGVGLAKLHHPSNQVVLVLPQLQVQVVVSQRHEL